MVPIRRKRILKKPVVVLDPVRARRREGPVDTSAVRRRLDPWGCQPFGLGHPRKPALPEAAGKPFFSKKNIFRDKAGWPDQRLNGWASAMSGDLFPLPFGGSDRPRT